MHGSSYKRWPKRSGTTPRELTLGRVVLGTRRLTRGASRLREPSSQKARASRGKTTRRLRAWSSRCLKTRCRFRRHSRVTSPDVVTSEEKLNASTSERRGGAHTRAHDARHRHHTYFTVYDDLGYVEAAPRYSRGYRRRGRRLLEPSPRRDLHPHSQI